MRVYCDRDTDLNLIKGNEVCVVGYDSQGHAHAPNLKDSGVKDISIALREGSASANKADAAGFRVLEVAEAVKQANVMMMLPRDEVQGDTHRGHLRANMKNGAALLFAHGRNVHFNLLEARRFRRADDRARAQPPRALGIPARRRWAVPDRDPQGRLGQRP